MSKSLTAIQTVMRPFICRNPPQANTVKVSFGNLKKEGHTKGVNSHSWRLAATNHICGKQASAERLSLKKLLINNKFLQISDRHDSIKSVVAGIFGCLTSSSKPATNKIASK